MGDRSQDAGGAAEEIKTMKLYSDIERIDNELRELGVANGASIDPTQLFALDSLHYEGTEACDAAITALNLDASSQVLDVGAGLGGPARYLAHTAGCDICAVELQDDVHSKAAELTQRAGLAPNVSHVRADFLTFDLASLGSGEGTFDAVVSWLVFLHIADKGALLPRCAAMLKPGGTIYVEDFFEKSPFSGAETRSLRDDVYCADLPTRDKYVAALEAAGFTDIVFEEKTVDWTAFVDDRLGKFVAARERFVRVHSEGTYDKLHHFYSAMSRLFNGGNLGGVRLQARKA